MSAAASLGRQTGLAGRRGEGRSHPSLADRLAAGIAVPAGGSFAGWHGAVRIAALNSFHQVT